MSQKKLFYLYILVTFFHTTSFALGRQEYTVGVENLDYYPFYSVNNKGEYIGFAKDVFELYAKENNIKFIYEVRSIKRLNQQFFEERRFDFKFPDNRFWRSVTKNNDDLFYSTPVCNFIDGVIVLTENKDKDINFFKTQGIGKVRGYTILGYESTGIPVSESTNVETLIERLKYGTIQGAYFNVAVALSKVNNQKEIKDKFVFNQKVPYYKSGFSLSSFNHQEVIYNFDKFLSEERDKINLLKKKYGIKD